MPLSPLQVLYAEIVRLKSEHQSKLSAIEDLFQREARRVTKEQGIVLTERHVYNPETDRFETDEVEEP